MKIGILTFHMAFNYGAMLQSYALSNYLTHCGHEVEIIDYRLPAINKYYAKSTCKQLLKKKGFLGGSIRFIKRILTRYYTKDKKWLKFYRYMTKTLKLSNEQYDTASSLENLQYDAFICGSDQIWNSDLTDGFCKEYYLDFVRTNAKKIAYAASNGRSFLKKKEQVEILSLLKEFNAVGVREEGLANYLNYNCGVKAAHVIDPVFLLQKHEWELLTKRVKFQNYLLIYAFDEDELIYNVAKNIAQKKDLKIISLAYRKRKDLPESILQLTDCGPVEFISLFKNAKYVCTTSFHGTAFSLIFRKDFYCFPHKQYGERTNSLLNCLGLSNRNVYTESDITSFESIDYTPIEEKMNDMIYKSKQFIKNALN